MMVKIYAGIGRPKSEQSGSICCMLDRRRSGEGGTGQALRLAKMLNIPILDFGVYDAPQGWYHMADYIAAMYGVK